ncbi:hypothetical protein ACJJTC_007864 [Scirpophaga incertulas]
MVTLCIIRTIFYSRHKHIIENKCTNAISTTKKNEAWETITQEFNSNAEVPRTQKQLSTAYSNLKRTTRQNVANKHVQQYLESGKNDLCYNEVGPSQVITLNEESNIHREITELGSLVKQLKKDEIADKKGIMATGDGIFKPILGTVGAQILSIMGDQVKPLSNNCDSASSYYKNVEDVTTFDVVPVESNVTDALSSSVTPLIANPTQDTSKKIKHQRTTKKQPKKKIVPKYNYLIKKKYYETKMECVNLEKKNE